MLHPDVIERTNAVTPDAIVVMGVSGCGKTSVGRHLARLLGWPFLEGDEFHPPENIAKMSAGIPLRDEDRWGWLDSIGAQMSGRRAQGERVVVSCSALRRCYRDRLRAAGDLLFIHLQGARDRIEARMALRSGHYMPVGLLDSQFATLEALEPDERFLVCDIGPPAQHIAERLISQVAPPHP